MKNITLTTNTPNTRREVIVNWNNVLFAKEAQSVYGDSYVEVHFPKECIDVKETLQEIHEKCLNAIC